MCCRPLLLLIVVVYVFIEITMVSHKRSLDQDENEGDCSNKTIPILTATTEEVLVKKTRREGEADNVHEDDNLFHVLEHQNKLTCQMYDIVSGEEQKQIVNNSNAEGDDDLLHISNMYNALTCQLYDKLDANDSCFGDDDEEELDDDLITVLRSSLELLKHQHNNTIQELESTVVENKTLKAYVVSKESRIQELEELVDRLVARENSSNDGMNGSSSSGRERALKAVKDITEEYINDQCLDISTRSKIKNLIKSGRLDNHRELIQKEHAKRKPGHRYATTLMTNEQLSKYLYVLTDEYREKEIERTTRKDAVKRAILESILCDLQKNMPLIAPGSRKAAYIIQCIFNYARLHHKTSEATCKMLTAILVQIQEFGDGEDFLKSWGVKPLTTEDIKSFKADVDNWPYLQGGIYVGLTGAVEYMDAQKNGTSNKYGAAETVSQIARNLGLGQQRTRVLAMGAISDSLYICPCRRSASHVESSMQTFCRGMYILAPPSKPRRDEVCVVSLQKFHDKGSSTDTIGDGDGTRANGVFITCIPSHSADTNIRNTDGTFKVIDSFIPQRPVPTFANVKVPQGFGRGGTKPEKK